MVRNRGFTWIELVIILAVIAILGAMAIPGMHDTTLKKQVKGGMALGDVAPIAWLCHSADVPGGMDARGHDETDIPAKWLPLECRGAPTKK